MYIQNFIINISNYFESTQIIIIKLIAIHFFQVSQKQKYFVTSSVTKCSDLINDRVMIMNVYVFR